MIQLEGLLPNVTKQIMVVRINTVIHTTTQLIGVMAIQI